MTSGEDLRKLVETAERELGPIDILVNNAGIEITKSLQDTSFEEIDAVVRTNLSAPVWLIKMVLPQMVERRRGAIVNVSSLAGKSCAPYDAIYSATKAGLIALGLSVDLELDGTGVTVGTLCPGFVSEAGMWANSGSKAPPMLRSLATKVRECRAQGNCGFVAGARFIGSDKAVARTCGAGAGFEQAYPKALRCAQGVPGSRCEAIALLSIVSHGASIRNRSIPAKQSNGSDREFA